MDAEKNWLRTMMARWMLAHGPLGIDQISTNGRHLDMICEPEFMRLVYRLCTRWRYMQYHILAFYYVQEGAT